MSQRPMRMLPQVLDCSPTALLRWANAPLAASGENPVSSWKKALSDGLSDSVPRTPRREDWSVTRVRRGRLAAFPPLASTVSSITNTRP